MIPMTWEFCYGTGSVEVVTAAAAVPRIGERIEFVDTDRSVTHRGKVFDVIWTDQDGDASIWVAAWPEGE